MDDLSVSGDIVACCDQYVVHVYKDFGGVAHFHFSEHAIHGSLEGGQGVG